MMIVSIFHTVGRNPFIYPLSENRHITYVRPGTALLKPKPIDTTAILYYDGEIGVVWHIICDHAQYYDKFNSKLRTILIQSAHNSNINTGLARQLVDDFNQDPNLRQQYRSDYTQIAIPDKEADELEKRTRVRNQRQAIVFVAAFALVGTALWLVLT